MKKLIKDQVEMVQSLMRERASLEAEMKRIDEKLERLFQHGMPAATSYEEETSFTYIDEVMSIFEREPQTAFDVKSLARELIKKHGPDLVRVESVKPTVAYALKREKIVRVGRGLYKLAPKNLRASPDSIVHSQENQPVEHQEGVSV